MDVKRRKITLNELEYPSEKDEPSFICRLHLSSYSVYVELSGWSSLIPTKLGEINFNPATGLTNFIDLSSGRINRKAREWLESQSPFMIRQASQLIGSKEDVTALLMVQVVAKRKVEVITIKDRIFLICTLVIADSSGYCLLTCMNEGLQVVYNRVDIGDVLLLTRFRPQKPRQPVHMGLFASRYFVNMEIKIPFHTARHHFHYNFDYKKQTISSYFKMSQSLYDGQFKVFLPNQLQQENINSDFGYFDLVGVISYVGRIQRHRVAGPACVETNDSKMIYLPKYIMYRWIKVIGKTDKSLPVKLYIYNQMLEYQALIVPGAHVVISHCNLKEDQYITSVFVTTSEFSHIFLERKIVTYFRHRPLSIWNTSKEIFERNSYISILSRNDIDFSIGGTYHVEKVLKESKFISMYTSKQYVLDNEINTPIRRRESRYVFVKGRIKRAFKILSNEHLTHFQYIEVFGKNHKVETNVTTDLYYTHTFHPSGCTWYTFMRKLPSLSQEVLLEPSSRLICKRVTEEYARYCGPLLLPATKTAWGDLSHMADLTCIDPQPFIEVDIISETTSTEWQCLWKQPGLSFDERIAKINSAAAKSVICILEVFCVEDDSDPEISLIDFVVLTQM